MTGRGRGGCVLKAPSLPGEPVTGFAGWSGRPVSWLPSNREVDLAYLRSQAQRIAVALANVRRRIASLGERRGKTSAPAAEGSRRGEPRP
jgi:hypothetical protein